MIRSGIPAEQARGILPLDTATTLVMTANLREWISVFKLRCDKASHPQMVELMTKIKEEFVKRLPWFEYAA
jgi:thymidylate synthase (FAD)